MTTSQFESNHHLDLSQKDNRDWIDNNEFTMKVGERLRIDLDENPTTGYQWQINMPPTNEGTDPIAIEQNAYAMKQMEATVGGAHLVGGGGKRTLVIIGNSEGSATIEAAYARPWEFKGFNQASSSEQHTIRIKVLPS